MQEQPNPGRNIKVLTLRKIIERGESPQEVEISTAGDIVGVRELPGPDSCVMLLRDGDERCGDIG